MRRSLHSLPLFQSVRVPMTELAEGSRPERVYLMTSRYADWLGIE
jgi:hypothetical protein